MIQRLDPDMDGEMNAEADGEYVTFTDHVADKAEAVAEAVEEATAEMRAELVALLERDALRMCHVTSESGWMSCVAAEPWPFADRLASLGAWERLWSGTRYHYQPIEPRSSGGSDGQTKAR